jgi:hypothetical protein
VLPDLLLSVVRSQLMLGVHPDPSGQGGRWMADLVHSSILALPVVVEEGVKVASS